jgi:hypothetical protein
MAIRLICYPDRLYNRLKDFLYRMQVLSHHFRVRIIEKRKLQLSSIQHIGRLQVTFILPGLAR